MNRKIFLMILFSFAAHMAIAAAIVYFPSNMNTNKSSGYKDKVIWGYFSGSAKVEGIRQSGVIVNNVSSKDRGNSAENVIHTEAGIKYNQNDPDSNISKKLTKDVENNLPVPPLERGGEGGFDRVGMGFSGGPSDSASDHAPLPGGSSDAGDSMCPATAQCGRSDGQRGNSGNGGFDNHAIMEYVRKQIERHKYYPHIAKLRGIEGTVYLNFYIGQDGMPGSITISRSSGSEILDKAGIQTIMKIGKISNLHKELRELDIVVPITYKLE